MNSAAHHSIIGVKKTLTVLKTLNLNSAKISGLSCPINGLTNCTIFGWVRNLAHPIYAPAWNQSGSWGATYFSYQDTHINTRFGTGSTQSNKHYDFSPQPNTWYHYCYVRDTSGSTGLYIFYLNGAVLSTLSGNNTALRNNSSIFTLANGLEGHNVNTDESVVAYGLFNRALSAAEVAQMYAQKIIDITKPPFDRGLLMGLNITEGSGNKIFDIVSGNYVTISSTPNWTVDFPL